ncbi:MAG: Ig-like domain-containing protein [Bacteroidota bacterium]
MRRILFILWVLAGTHSAYSQAPSWSVTPTDFNNSMTLVAVVEVDDVELGNTSDILGAFVGNEVRGVTNSFFFSSTGRYFFFLTIYSDAVNGETITFKVYDASNDATVDLANTVEFTAELISGELSNPVVLTNDITAVDNDGPQVILSTAASNPTNQSSFTVNFDFDEKVKSFTVDDVTSTNAILSSFTGADQSYSCLVSPVADGPVTLQLDADVLTDVPGNSNEASDLFSVLYYSDLIYTSTGWSNVTGPDESNSVVIAHDLAITALPANDLYVDTEVSITVNTDGSMVVNGNLENNGSINLLSGAALVNDNYSGSGTFTYKRNTTYGVGQGRYSFIGSPVADHDLSATQGGFKFIYEEATDSYADASGVTSMVAGVGYTIANNDEIEFTGTPHSGNIFVPVTSDLNGFNLIANPYPAAIGYAEFMNANLYDAVTNPLGSITGTIYIWDDGDSKNKEPISTDFLTINAMGYVSGGNSRSANYQGYLPTAQGFIVEAVSGTGGAVLFQNDMKFNTNNSDDQFFRDSDESEIPLDQIKLLLSDEAALRSETIVGYRQDATIGRDLKYDALKVSGNSKLQLFSITENQASYAIQAIDRGVFSLAFTIEEAGFYQLSTVQVHPEQQSEFLLTDRLTGIKIPIGEISYRFYATESVEDRFLLELRQPFVDDEIPDEQSFALRVTSDQLTVILQNQGQERLQVLDLQGKLLVDALLEFSEGVANVPVQLHRNQVYLVRVGNKMQKVMMR